MPIEEFPYDYKDMPYLEAAIQRAGDFFVKIKMPNPVKLLHVRNHEMPGKAYVTIEYEKPGDLFFLGSVQKSIKEKERLDKIVDYYEKEQKEILTFHSN